MPRERIPCPIDRLLEVDAPTPAGCSRWDSAVRVGYLRCRLQQQRPAPGGVQHRRRHGGVEERASRGGRAKRRGQLCRRRPLGKLPPCSGGDHAEHLVRFLGVSQRPYGRLRLPSNNLSDGG
jgi:hypothetical protein